jgi:thioredoxin-like negative regulator of GroEL
MKSKKILLPLLILLFSFSVNAQISWLTDFSEASRIAAETGKPMLLDFTASWCGPCRKMDEEFWIRADVADLSKQFVCVKIDADNNVELKRQYRVGGIPNVVLTDSAGNTISSNKGFGKNTDKTIISKINAVLVRYKSRNQIAASVEIESNDLSALAKLAKDYQQKKSYLKSAEIFERILRLESDPIQREIVLLNIGYDYLRARQFEKAIEMFGILQNEFPKGVQLELAVYGEFLAFEKQNQFSRAQRSFEKLKAEFPKSGLIKQAEQLLPQNNQEPTKQK